MDSILLEKPPSETAFLSVSTLLSVSFLALLPRLQFRKILDLVTGGKNKNYVMEKVFWSVESTNFLLCVPQRLLSKGK